MAHEIDKRSREGVYGDLADLRLAAMAEFEAFHTGDVCPPQETYYPGAVVLSDVEKPGPRLSEEQAQGIVARQEARDQQLFQDLADQDAHPSERRYPH